MEHSPVYDFYETKHRSDVWWKTGTNQWVGIWGYDWPDRLGDELFKYSDEFQYEVWQPDFRVDINSEKPAPIPLEVARAYYHWPNVVDRYLKI